MLRARDRIAALSAADFRQLLALPEYITNRAFFRTFSFRAGSIIFLTFCIVLISLRVYGYYQDVASARDDTRTIVMAYRDEIHDYIETRSTTDAMHYIAELPAELHDRHVIIALRKGSRFAGNLDEWPQAKPSKEGWLEFVVPTAFVGEHVKVLANLTRYPQGTLMVGYDLSRLEVLERSLWATLMQDVILALFAAFGLSVALIILLNRNMRKLNRTCNEVMLGNMASRVPLSGGDDEFDRLARNVNAMLDRNDILLSTVKDSTNALAHDMRTPLSRLRITLLKALDQEALPPGAEKALADSIGQTDGLVEMFENILAIAKAESRSETQSFVSFNLTALVRDVCDFYALFVEDKEQTLMVLLPDKEIEVFGDRQLLAQAISNLLDNAVKYTPAEGHIAVSVAREKNEVIITVADNGPGIPEHLREKVKERFFCVDESRHEAGTGLGMSLVDAVAKLFQGQLLLEDNAPGLRAKLVLPALDRPR